MSPKRLPQLLAAYKIYGSCFVDVVNHFCIRGDVADKTKNGNAMFMPMRLISHVMGEKAESIKCGSITVGG